MPKAKTMPSAVDDLEQLDHQSNSLAVATALAVSAFLAFVYLLTYSGVPHNPDDWFYLAGTQAILSGQFADLQSHGWLFSWLVLPFYALSRVVPQLGSFQAAALANIVITALTAALLYLALAELHLSSRLRVLAAVAYGLGTLAWPYSHYLFREPAAALFLLAATWALMRFWRRPGWRPLLAAGLCYAAALAVKDTLIAFLPFVLAVIVPAWLRGRALAGQLPAGPGPSLIAQIRASDRTWLWPWLGLLLGMVLIIPLTTLLLQAFPQVLLQFVDQAPNLLAFAALWISPGWGLLVFAPVLWIAVLGAPILIRRHGAIALLAIGGSVFYVFAATTLRFWWGYWGFGPRQLLPLLPLLCLSLPLGVRWLRQRWSRAGRWGVAGLLALSMLVQLVGVLIPYNQYVRQVILQSNITGPEIAWSLKHWPLLGMLRFAAGERLDPAWLQGPTPGPVVHWPVVLPLLLSTLASLLWLIYLTRQPAGPSRSGGRMPGWMPWAGSLLLASAWVLAALLATRSVYLDPRYQPELGFESAAQHVQQHRQPGDLLITDLWTDNLTGPLEAMLNYCQGNCPTRLDLVREDLVDRTENWTVARQADLAGYSRAWLVMERVAEGDPNSIVEQWLGQIGYPETCQWTGPQVRLCLYQLAPGSNDRFTPIGATFDERFQLVGAEIKLGRTDPNGAAVLQPGDPVLVQLRWEGMEEAGGDYLVSLQLLGPDGKLITAVDRMPGNGFRPTSSWLAGEIITDRYSLTLPDDAPTGTYQLISLMYDPTTGQRLSTQLPDGTPSDAVHLLRFQVLRTEKAEAHGT